MSEAEIGYILATVGPETATQAENNKAATSSGCGLCVDWALLDLNQ